MKYYNSIIDLIGKTPLVRLHRVTDGIAAPILVKLESQNPGGSVKDRIGIAMIEAAEREGKLKPGGLIVEPTSGNTGIGLVIAANAKGYKCLFVMTDKASQERVRILKALGADVMIVPSAVKPNSPEYYTNAAKRLAEQLPNAAIINQFDNQSNPEAHYNTTGPEIWEDTEGKVTHFIAGVGTGGTVTGTARFLKEKNPNIKIIIADPVGSCIRSFKETGRLMEALPYLVEGVGQECIPGALNLNLVDEVVSIPDKESFTMARRLAREESIFCGGSSGMNVVAAMRIARSLPEDAVVVTIICDTGERYLSKHHSDEWLKEKQLLDNDRISMRLLVDNKRTASRIPTLVSVTPSTTVQQTLDLMTQYEISELPVMDNGKVMGRVRENRLFARLLEDRSITDSTVETVMEESMPAVDAHADVKDAIAILRESPSILVEEFGRVIGVISRHDVLEYL